jgi:hypothetical protein
MSLKSKLEVISDLMSELMQNMEPGKDDLDERLGRKKPMAVEIEIEGKDDMPESNEEEMMEPEHKYGGGMEEEMGEEHEDPSILNRLKKLKKSAY